jgi:outer membrane protein OmpA-like peptidoglycan-associated protein
MSSIRCVLIFLLLNFSILQAVYSQQVQDPETAKAFFEQAELTLAETKAMEIALDQLTTAANLDTTFVRANYEAAHMHFLTINKDDAVKYLLRVYRQDPDYRFDLEYWIAKSYQFGLEFDKAIEFYNLYKQKLEKKPNYQGKDKQPLSVVERGIFECQNGKEYVANPLNYSIVNIGREINSEFEDYGPVVNEKEDEIVFTSRRRDENLNQNVDVDNKPFEDIFISNKTGGKWEYAKNIGPVVNTPYHGSNLALSADGNTLFIYKDDNGGDIYYCERKDNGNWGEPIPLPGIINSSFEEKSITVSKDEKTLYFTSNRPGGFGGSDLYKATKDTKGEWSNVKNLGGKINTEFDEDGPFIDYDGVTLFFSSKGHKGMGGHDIFKSTYNPNKNEWTEPTNMGYPINTPDDDIYFISTADGKRAYYSSVRDDGMGYTDIYVVSTPDDIKKIDPLKTEPVVVKEPPVDTTATTSIEPTDIKVEPKKEPKTEPKIEPKKEVKPLRYVVNVIDAADKSPISAKLKLQGARDNVIVKSTTTSPGVFEFTITSKQPKDYRLIAEMDGYVFQNQTVRIQGASTEEKTLTRTVELRKIAVRVASILRNIYFDFDKATFKTDSYAELNLLESMLRQNPNMSVEIGGHTDAVGTLNYNIFLSRKRAEAVKDFLTKKGIDPRRIKAVGYGKSKPLASNDDEDDGRELNRRVEFKVLQN